MKRLTTLDVLVLALTSIGFALVFVGGSLGDPLASIVVGAFAVSFCVLLLAWMGKGGWASPLWSWLPPFFPWGLIVKGKGGRWAVVAVLVAGTTAGLVATLLGGDAAGSIRT